MMTLEEGKKVGTEVEKRTGAGRETDTTRASGNETANVAEAATESTHQGSVPASHSIMSLI